uniref:WW domain-containing protein n=1 Tax=Strongyloides stercoralis TaxID=6248 RepID=A0A0K0E105_STRER
MQEGLYNNLPGIMASQRRTKQNLACFLNDKIFDSSFKNTSTETSENNISCGKKVSLNNTTTTTKNEINTTTDSNTLTNSNIKKGNRKQKKVASANTLGSAMQSILIDDKLASPTLGGIGKEKKEDYWYYDKESDGFYYEFAGSRGWRKRNKNTPIQSLPQTTQTFKSKNPLPMEIPHPHDNENVPNYFYNEFSTNKSSSSILPSTSSSGSLTNKVYDPHSDGYYYNMGSVEGWKRRTDSVTSSSKNSCSSPIFNNQQSIRSQVQSNESAISYDNEWIINGKEGDNKNINEFGSSAQSTGSSAASSILDEGFRPKFFIPNQNSITSRTYASYFDNLPSNRDQQRLLQHLSKNDSIKQSVYGISINKNNHTRNFDVELQQENNQLGSKINYLKTREPQIFDNVESCTFVDPLYEYNDIFLASDLNKAFSTSECFNDRSNLIDTTNRDVWGFRTTNSDGGSYICGGEETDYKALEQIWQNLDNNLLTGGEIGCTN